MSRTTRRAAAAFSLISLGMGALAFRRSCGDVHGRSTLRDLKVPNFTVASAKAAEADGPSPARCIVEGGDRDRRRRSGAKLGQASRPAPADNWNGKLVFFGVGGLAGCSTRRPTCTTSLQRWAAAMRPRSPTPATSARTRSTPAGYSRPRASRTRPRSSIIFTARRIKRRPPPRRWSRGSTPLRKCRAPISTAALSAVTWA